MEKLQVIKHPRFGSLSIMIIDGKEMFKANECAAMLGYAQPKDAISRHCKGAIFHRLPTKSGEQNVKFIPEGDVWRLIIRSKLPQAEEIEKWIMDEVLPTIRKTGTYTMQDKQTKEYEYFDKTYNGVPVLTTSDVEYLTKINRATVDWNLRTKLVNGKDYYYITGAELKSFKKENPRVSKLSSAMYLVTREGFIKLCRAYDIKMEEPKCFETKVESKKIDKFLNKEQAIAIFKQESLLIGEEDVILSNRVAELFGEDIVQHVIDKIMYNARTQSRVNIARWYNCNQNFDFFTLQDFYKAVSYYNTKNASNQIKSR